jgi:hypothetical protein
VPSRPWWRGYRRLTSGEILARSSPTVPGLRGESAGQGRVVGVSPRWPSIGGVADGESGDVLQHWRSEG